MGRSGRAGKGSDALSRVLNTVLRFVWLSLMVSFASIAL